MKKSLALVFVFVLALALAGCASGGSSSSSDASSSETEIANPWTEVDSAQAAAEGAGIESFEVADNLGLSDLEFASVSYRYMDGIAEADFDGGAFKVTVRKSTKYTGQELSGDYTEYPEQWVVMLKDLGINCQGYERDKASSLEWSRGRANYSVVFTGLGGENMAITDSDIIALPANVK